MRIFHISREIGIDAGHRVTHHGSKCKNLHGHRYTIEAHCEGQLFEAGEQQGMVLDFGFLKDLMMEEIDLPCDHGTILWALDPFVDRFLDKANATEARYRSARDGFCLCESVFGKLYIIPDVPTAENLARHWFKRLQGPVMQRSQQRAHLQKVVVWETPNCKAEYHA